MLKKLGIKGRVLLLTLLPTSLMALVLGGYFTWTQQSDLQAQLMQRGEMIAEQLAPLVAPAMGRGDSELLERIATQSLEQPDVRAVTFLAPDHTPLAHAGPTMLNQAPSGDSAQLLRRSGNDATRYLLPVLGKHRNLAGELIPAESERLLGWVELELSHNGMLLRGYRSLFASLLLIGAGLAGAALLALRMGRTINHPLSQIKHAVAQLKDGHLETRLPPLGSQELDELADGINRMAGTLQNAQEELQHSVDQATEDVRQNLETIEIQNIELDLARKEALEASRIKSEFLANMSHEIRTPLNGILGFTHLLQKSELTPRQLDYLGTIEKSADSLLGIINEILDFSKIEAGKLVLDHIPFNLRDLLQDTLTILAPAAHAKQLELVSLVYRDTPLSLVGDPLRLKQILTNLVSNAIKFTREGTIVARAMLEEEHEDRVQLRISIQDTGIGLSSQDVRALFQAFSQADNSLSRQPGGTGLGLVISKRLIEQMGAKVLAVESGYAAVKAVQTESFDLVLMDVQMPGMDGRQSTETIRQWESERHCTPLPIVALTAHAMANEKRALLQSGMDDYLTKPISERQLAQVVLKWTGLALRNQAPDRSSESAIGSHDLPVLDHEEGLRLAAGKADLAADMLAMLLASLEADREAIRSARDSHDQNALIERVHRLHGATRYCGVPQLRAACQRSETLLKQDDPKATQALDELERAINRLATQAKISA